MDGSDPNRGGAGAEGGRGTFVRRKKYKSGESGRRTWFDEWSVFGLRIVKMLPGAEDARVAVQSRVIRLEALAVLRMIAVMTGGVFMSRVSRGIAGTGFGCGMKDRVQARAYHTTRREGEEKQEGRSLAHTCENGSFHSASVNATQVSAVPGRLRATPSKRGDQAEDERLHEHDGRSRGYVGDEGCEKSGDRGCDGQTDREHRHRGK